MVGQCHAYVIIYKQFNPDAANIKHSIFIFQSYSFIFVFLEINDKMGDIIMQEY